MSPIAARKVAMFDCPHCGNQLPEGAAFCNQCWRPVDDKPVAAARAAEPVAEAGPTEAVPVVPDRPHDPVPEMPTFTPAPGGPAPPEGDDVTSAYPQVPPPQPSSPWVSGSTPPPPAPPPMPRPGQLPDQPPNPQDQWGQQAYPQQPWGQPAPWGQPPGPAPYDPYGYGGAPPGGYPPGGYGAPPGGHPPQPSPYGYQQPYYGYPPQQGAGTNGMAIASLACSLSALLCGFSAILGVVFGHIALSQIKRTGQGGRGLAIAGLIVGYIMLVLTIVLFIAVAASDSGA